MGCALPRAYLGIPDFPGDTAERTLPMAFAAGLLAVALAAAADDDAHNMQMMDGNGDGMISAAEHATGARQMFAKMDADHDGRVTASEMDAMHAQMKPADTAGPTMSSAEKIKTID